MFIGQTKRVLSSLTQNAQLLYTNKPNHKTDPFQTYLVWLSYRAYK